jgi:phosphoribosylformylglycinamidine synthase
MKARVFVTLKSGVLDPQGAAIGSALEGMGFEGVESIRQGKVFEIDMADASREEASEQLDAMCRRLLANTVIEDYSVELD